MSGHIVPNEKSSVHRPFPEPLQYFYLPADNKQPPNQSVLTAKFLISM